MAVLGSLDEIYIIFGLAQMDPTWDLFRVNFLTTSQNSTDLKIMKFWSVFKCYCNVIFIVA